MRKLLSIRRCVWALLMAVWLLIGCHDPNPYGLGNDTPADMRKALVNEPVQDISAAACAFTGVAKTQTCADKQSAEYSCEHFVALVVGKISEYIVGCNSDSDN